MTRCEYTVPLPNQIFIFCANVKSDFWILVPKWQYKRYLLSTCHTITVLHAANLWIGDLIIIIIIIIIIIFYIQILYHAHEYLEVSDPVIKPYKVMDLLFTTIYGINTESHTNKYIRNYSWSHFRGLGNPHTIDKLKDVSKTVEMNQLYVFKFAQLWYYGEINLYYKTYLSFQISPCFIM